jgi:hypothetical protein
MKVFYVGTREVVARGLSEACSAIVAGRASTKETIMFLLHDEVYRSLKSLMIYSRLIFLFRGPGCNTKMSVTRTPAQLASDEKRRQNTTAQERSCRRRCR